MPLTFADIYSQYRGTPDLPPSMSLDAFSRFANETTGSQDYSAAEGSNALKKGSYWIDQALNATHLPDVTGALGRKAFELFGGTPSVGEEVGRGLPRTALNMAPLALGPEMMPVAMGLQGLDTYEKTGSPLEAGVSAGTLPLMGKGGELMSAAAERFGLIKPIEETLAHLSQAGNPTASLMYQKSLEVVGDKLTNYVAHNIGAIGTAELVNYAKDAIQHGTWDPYEGESVKDKVLSTTIGNLPWMISGGKEALKPGRQVIEQRLIGKTQVPTDFVTDPSKVNEVDTQLMQSNVQKQQHVLQALAIEDPVQREAAIAQANLDHEIGKVNAGIAKGEQPGKGFSLWTDEAAPLKAVVDTLGETKTQADEKVAPDVEAQKATTLTALKGEVEKLPESDPSTVLDSPSPVTETAKQVGTADLLSKAHSGESVAPESRVEQVEIKVAQGMPVEEALAETAVATVNEEKARAQKKLDALEKAMAQRKTLEEKKAQRVTEKERVSTTNDAERQRVQALVESGKAEHPDDAAALAELKKQEKGENYEKALNAWVNWRKNQTGSEEEREVPVKGKSALDLLKGKMSLAISREKIPETVDTEWHKNPQGNVMKFKADDNGQLVGAAQGYLDKLNAKRSAEEKENFEWRAYRGTQVGKGNFGLKKFFFSKEAKDQFKNKSSRRSPEEVKESLEVAKKEAEAVVKKISKKEEDPDNRQGQISVENAIDDFFADQENQKNLFEAGISGAPRQNLVRLLKEGKVTLDQVKDQLAKVLEAKVEREAEEAWRNQEEYSYNEGQDDVGHQLFESRKGVDKKTYFIRHGSTALNGEANGGQDRIRGWANVPLAEKGVKDAEKTGEELKGKGITRVFTSDLDRAVQTGQIIAGKIGAEKVETTSGLRPWSLGHFIEGHLASDVTSRIHYYIDHPDEAPAGGESFHDFAKRFLETYYDLQTRFKGENIAIVSHYRNMRFLDAWRKAGIDNNDYIPDLIKEKGGEPGSYQTHDKFGNQLTGNKVFTIPPIKAPPKVPMPGVEGALHEVLRRSGASKRERDFFVPKLKGMMDQYGLANIKMGLIIDPKGEMNAMGLANMRAENPVIWIQPREDGTFSIKDARDLQGVIAHEMGHAVHAAVRAGVLKGTKIHDAAMTLDKWFQGKPEEALDFLREWHQELPEHYRQNEQWVKALESTDYGKDPQELWANANAMWALTRGSADNPLGFAMPPPMRSFIERLTTYSRKLLGSMKSALFVNSDFAGKDFKSVQNDVIKTFDGVTTMLRESKTAMKNYDTLLKNAGADAWSHNIYLLTPSKGKFVDELAQSRRGKPLSDKKEEGPVEHYVHGFLQTMQGLEAHNPSFKAVTGPVLDMSPHMAVLRNQATAPLYGGLDSSGAVSMRTTQAKYMGMIKGSDKLKSFISDVGQWLQRRSDVFSFDMLKNTKDAVWAKRDLNQQASKLTDVEKAAVSHWFQATQESMKLVGKQTIEAIKQQGRNAMSTYFGEALPNMWSKAPEASNKLTEALDKAMSQQPQVAMIGARELDAVRQSLGNDEVFNGAMNQWMRTTQTAQQLQEFYDKNPNHLSLIRMGNIHVRAYDDQGNEHADNLQDMKQYAEWKQKRQSEGFTKFSEPETTKRGSKFTFNDEIMNILKDQHEKFEEQVNAMPLSDASKAMILSDGGVLGNVSRLMNAQDVRTPGWFKDLSQGGRRNVAGSMDLVATQDAYRALTARMNASSVMRSRVAYGMTNPELAKDPAGVERFKKMLENFMTPDSSLGRAIQKYNAVYYLGGNLATLATQLSHQWMSVFPELISRGNGTIKSMRLLAGAAGTMAEFSKNALLEKVGLDKDHLAIKKMKDPEERLLMQYANDTGLISFGDANDLYDSTASGSIDLNSAASKGVVGKVADRAKSTVSDFANLSLKAFAATDHFNTRTALLAGFRLARTEMGQNYGRNKAFEYAKDFLRTSTYQGGKANRPVIPFEGDYKVLGHMAYSLSRYTLGWLNQLSRYVSHWKGSEYLGLSPEQRANARNGAVAMLGTKFAAAGVLGLPFVGIALKLLEKASGQDLQGKLWSQLGTLLDKDKEEGEGLTNVIMTGAVNAGLARSGLPIDLGSRWGFNGLLGLSAYDGFSGDNVFGPTGGVVSSVLAGLKSAQSGNLAGAVRAVSPPAIRRGIAYWANGGQVQTSKGHPLPTSDVEDMAYVMGFDPQRLTKLNRLHGIQSQAGQEAVHDDQKDAADVLGRLEADPEDARRRVLEISQESQGVEPSDRVAARVAKASADKIFPEDPRASVPPRQAQHLMQVAEALGVTLPEARQAAKSQYIDNMMETLGVRGRQVSAGSLYQDQAANEGSGWSPFQRRNK